MLEIVIRLKKSNAEESWIPEEVTPEGEVIPEYPVYDWIPALIMAAHEVQALNAYAGTPEFPRAIPCRPDAVWRVENEDGTFGLWQGTPENVLGEANTLPDASGSVVVRVDYDDFELEYLPAMPTTFSFKYAGPGSTVGAIAG